MRSAFVFSLLVSTGAALDERGAKYKRLAPGELQRELALQSAPVIPFKNFSAAYVKHALATPINWTALGAVTPVKDQGVHGYCGTFGRVGSCEGQLALKKGMLVSLAEEELIDCIGWDQDQVRATRKNDVFLRKLAQSFLVTRSFPPDPNLFLNHYIVAVLVFCTQWLHAYVSLPLQHDGPGHGPPDSIQPVQVQQVVNREWHRQ